MLVLDCRTVEENSPSPTCSKSIMTLVEADSSSSVSRETLSAIAKRRRRGGVRVDRIVASRGLAVGWTEGGRELCR